MEHVHHRNALSFEETISREMDAIELCEKAHPELTDQELWLNCYPNRLSSFVARSM